MPTAHISLIVSCHSSLLVSPLDDIPRMHPADESKFLLVSQLSYVHV